MRIAFSVERTVEDVVVGALVERGHTLVARFSEGDDVPALIGPLGPDVLVVTADQSRLNRATLVACDEAGVRLVALTDGERSRRLASALGVYDVVSVDAPLDELDEFVVGGPVTARARRRSGDVVAVWGPSGAPGRTTIAITIAHELSLTGATVALVDADTVGSSIAPALGMLDEAPGLAAACRLAGHDALTVDELDRVARDHPVDRGRLAVLTGITRSSRWPELSADRVSRSLAVCREWADHVIVDTGFSIEDDEELTSDLFAPRRNAATIASLRAADRVVAVGAADPVGVTRFIRAYADVRELVGADTTIDTVMNRVRSSTVGVGAAHQLVTTLRRFGGIDEALLVPNDQRAADAAVLEARPMGEVSPRSGAVAEVRRYVRSRLSAAQSVPEGRKAARRAASSTGRVRALSRFAPWRSA